MTVASQELARFVVSTEFRDLPEDVTARTKELVLDHLGVSIFGSTTPWAQIVTDLVIKEGGNSESSIYISGVKSTPRNAVLANGTMAHAFELDDTLYTLHPGAIVIPAAIALGEREHCSGKDVITAIVLGYEIMARIGFAVHTPGKNNVAKVYRTGHHASGVIGSFGAAVAAGKLLGLNEEKMVSALGLAANQQTGLMEFSREGTMEKRLFAGKPAHDGVLSAMLAATGFTAASTSLDGEFGFCRVFDRRANLSKLTRELGKTFRLVDTMIKPYASCRLIHPHIDAALKIAETHNVSPSNITEVVVWGGKSATREQHRTYHIPDVTTAQFSIPYCIAIAFIRRTVWVDDFTPQAFRDSRTQKLMRRIKVAYDRDMDRASGMGKVTVKLNSGKSITEMVHSAKGSAEDPLFKQTVLDKYRRLALIVLPEEQVDSIERLTQNLDKLRDISELADALRGKG